VYVVDAIGGLAYSLLLAQDLATALEAANQAISVAPDRIFIYGNRAHALMLLGLRAFGLQDSTIQRRSQKKGARLGAELPHAFPRNTRAMIP
jgi:hypothetical protein